MGTRNKLSLTALTVAFFATSAYAGGGDTPPLTMSVKRSGNAAYENVLFGEETNPGFFVYDDVYDDPFGDWGYIYHWEYDEDTSTPNPSGTGGASAFATFALTNNTGGPETFTVTAFVPLLQALTLTSTSGDVEGGLADSNADGFSLLEDAGGPIYTGLVDNVSTLTLMDDPFSFSAPAFGSASFGPFAGAAGGPALADTNIGIEITFVLSEGDTANFTANFFLEGQIPAPGAFALLGLAGLTGRRRRRS